MSARPVRRLVSLAVAGSLLAGCGTPPGPTTVIERKDDFTVQVEQTRVDYCRMDAEHARQYGYFPDPKCAKLPADYGKPTVEKVIPPCTDDLYAVWQQRCPWGKVKAFLVAATGGLLMGFASGGGGYGSGIDGGRYKGYKTYDSTYRSRYGTTRCRTQVGDGKAYTSCD